MNSVSIILLFCLFGASLGSLGFVGNMYPIGGGSTNLEYGQTVSVYLQVYKAGVTDQSGQGANISCYLLGNFSRTSLKMAWNPFFTSNPSNDEYLGTLNSTVIGLGSFTYTGYCLDETDNTTNFQNAGPAGLHISPIPTTAQATTAVPTTAVPTTGVPTTAIPTTAVPTTAIPTTGVPIISCSKLGLRARCRDIICGYYNTFNPDTDYIPSNDGVASLGVLPRNYSKVLVYLMRGLTGYPFDNTTATQDGTYFEFWVDAGQFSGRAVQLIITYDWTGDGSWDRTETFPFFATDPLPGYEVYRTNVKGILPLGKANVVGDAYSPFRNGKIRLEFWAALADPDGSVPIALRTDTVISGQLSSISIPYVVNYWTEPTGCTYPNPTTGVPTTGAPTTAVAVSATSPSKSIAAQSDTVSEASIQQFVACWLVLLAILLL